MHMLKYVETQSKTTHLMGMNSLERERQLTLLARNSRSVTFFFCQTNGTSSEVNWHTERYSIFQTNIKHLYNTEGMYVCTVDIVCGCYIDVCNKPCAVIKLLKRDLFDAEYCVIKMADFELARIGNWATI